MAFFALMSPLGSYLADIIEPLRLVLPQLRALVLGIFLHIATTILYESTEAHQFNSLKLFAVGIGIGAGALAILI